MVKVGGSLLQFPGLSHQLSAWLSAQPAADYVLIAGGGVLAEAIRRIDATQGLGEESAHWICVRAMSVTARMLAAILPTATLLDDLRAMHSKRNRSARSVSILDVEPFLLQSEQDHEGVKLPPAWSVSSDSIAARVGVVLSTAELVLLKSTLPPPHATLASAASDHYVDSFFPTIATGLPRVRCVDLRDRAWPEIILWQRQSES